MKRILSIILAMLMIVSMGVVVSAVADGEDISSAVNSTATADETVVATVDETTAATEPATSDETAPAETTLDETEPAETYPVETTAAETSPAETTAAVTEPASEDEKETDISKLPSKPAGTYRYYFYLPYDLWLKYNPYANTAGIYYWEGTNAPGGWPGYAANPTGYDNIYYFDVYGNVPTIIWNNHLDGGDSSSETYNYAYQTKDIPVLGYYEGESSIYPAGLDNFDNMIYVIDYSMIDINSYSGKETIGGEWFFYYGNGKYGTAENKADAKTVYNADNIDVSQVDPAEIPTKPVTEPTEAPVTTVAPIVTEPEEITTAAPVEPTEAPATTAEPTETTGASVITVPSATDDVTVVPTTTQETDPQETTSAATTPAVSAPADDGINRYYFYMPEYWETGDTSSVNVFWWEGTDACDSWPGYEALKADAEGVYYYDVPEDVEKIIFINSDADVVANQTKEIYLPEGYAEGANALYPEGLDSFDGMIFVCDERDTFAAEMGAYKTDGEWYYYYGNGEYGTAKNKENAEKIFTDSYLLEPGVEFPAYLLGDVNLDGKVNIKDATEVQKFIAKMIGLKHKQQKLADVNNDKAVNIKDATAIQKYVAKFETGYPIGETA